MEVRKTAGGPLHLLVDDLIRDSPLPQSGGGGREWHLGDTPSPPAEGAWPPLHSLRASFEIVS